jgi:hypothetical protein
MNDFEKEKFKRAARSGDDATLRDATREVWNHAWGSEKEETAAFMAETLKKEKHASGFGEDATYDGIRIHGGSFPRVEVTDPDPEPAEEVYKDVHVMDRPWRGRDLYDPAEDDGDEDDSPGEEEDGE